MGNDKKKPTGGAKRPAKSASKTKGRPGAKSNVRYGSKPSAQKSAYVPRDRDGRSQEQKRRERRERAIETANTEQSLLEGDMNIQWFPGHMTRARRQMAEDIKLVDAVCEIVDARIPVSSSNPDMDELTASKPRLVVLNRADLADSAVTRRWAQELRRRGFGVIETDCKSGRGVEKFHSAATELLSDLIAKRAERGQGGKLRFMVVGIPNVGKSTFINKLSGRKAANTADRPGVTRGRQWVTCDDKLELLDTPGILWPRFDDPATGERLAITGAVNDGILDIELLGTRLMLRLWEAYPERLRERYKLQEHDVPDPMEPLKLIAKRRGFLVSGGEPDTRRAAIVLLDEFRGGKLGRVSLESPPDGER